MDENKNRFVLGKAGMGKTYLLQKIARESIAQNILIVDVFNVFNNYDFLLEENVQNKRVICLDTDSNLTKLESTINELEKLNESVLIIFDDCCPDQALTLFEKSRAFNWDVYFSVCTIPDNAETFFENTHEFIIFNIKSGELDKLTNFVDLPKEEIPYFSVGEYMKIPNKSRVL